MNSTASLFDLIAVTDAVYRAEQTRLHELVKRETKLRSSLSKLEDARLSSRNLQPGQSYAINRIGADVLWQAWLGKSREELNRQLALCLAQKQRRLTTLRRAFGRYEAARQLLDQHKALQSARAAQADLATLQSLSITQRTDL